jgi:hypothetical protein
VQDSRKWWTPMACRCISPPHPVRRTTIGCARFSSAPYFRKRYCWQIEGMTPTESGRSSASKARGQTSRRNEIVRNRYASAPIFIGRATSSASSTRSSSAVVLRTRYDKLAANYLAFVKLASIGVWLVLMSPRPHHSLLRSSSVETPGSGQYRSGAGRSTSIHIQ